MQTVSFRVKRSREVDPHLKGLTSADDQFVMNESVRAVLSAVQPISGLQKIDGTDRQERV